jgi:phosphatidate cytidylyltransferase
MTNLSQRIIVALMGVLIMISGIIFSPWTYFVVFFIVCLLSLLEFYKLSGLDGYTPLKTWGSFSGMLIYTLIYLDMMNLITEKIYLIIFPVSAVIFFIKLYKSSDERPFSNIAYTFLGIIYVALPFSLLHMIAFYNGKYHYEIVIGILFLTWASDTGGYFAGTHFGRTKLFERISPMKSWEGFLGGLLLTILIAFGISHVFPILPLWKWIACGFITVIAGTYGDLVESLFKRSIKIKDSGTMLPGHGGFLDRFDAMLLSIPFVAAFLILL